MMRQNIDSAAQKLADSIGQALVNENWTDFSKWVEYFSKALDVYTHHQETSQANPRPALNYCPIIAQKSA